MVTLIFKILFNILFLIANLAFYLYFTSALKSLTVNRVGIIVFAGFFILNSSIFDTRLPLVFVNKLGLILGTGLILLLSHSVSIRSGSEGIGYRILNHRLFVIVVSMILILQLFIIV